MTFKTKFIVLNILLILNSMELYAYSNNAVVLMYHRFGENQYPSTNIRVDQFTEQLNFIQNNGYQVWPLSKIVTYLKAEQVIPDKVIAITIDDAYASVYKVAFPLLKQRKLPFTLFVATDPVDREFSNYMTWIQLRELVDSGVSLGNHSSSHTHLVEILPGETKAAWKARVVAEINEAEKRIALKTGVTTTLFAYPYGEFNIELSDTLKEMKYVAFGQQSGAIGDSSDFGFLPRFPVSEEYADLSEFALKLSSLSMPIKKVVPLEPVIRDLMPELTVTLTIKVINKNKLQCYISGQGKAQLQWQSDSAFIVKPVKALQSRRSRYNCTLQDEKTGRYYWYSHLWIRTDVAEE